MKQDEFFQGGEGDAWFERNHAGLSTNRKDVIVEIIQKIGLQPQRIAEVGCSNGWRLEKLREVYHAKCCGWDISKEAVANGCNVYPELELQTASLYELEVKEQFDVVICNFVLHWIDRCNLLRSIANIDTIVRGGGIVVLGDFLPDFNQKRWYHHLPNEKIYTYKQDYAELFKASGLYKEIYRETFNHDVHNYKIEYVNSQERAVCVVLRKMEDSEYYPEILVKNNTEEAV